MPSDDEPLVTQKVTWNWAQEGTLGLKVHIPKAIDKDGIYLSFKPEEILYVVQEYQKLHGGFEIPTDFSQWRGMRGFNG